MAEEMAEDMAEQAVAAEEVAAAVDTEVIGIMDMQ